MSEKKDSTREPADPVAEQPIPGEQPGKPAPEKTVTVAAPEKPESATAGSPQEAEMATGEKTVPDDTKNIAKEAGEKAPEKTINLEKEGEPASGEDTNEERAVPRTAEIVDDPKGDETPKPLTATAWGKIYNGCAKAGPIVLLLALCCMIWPEFFPANQALYCPAESQYISAFLRSSALDAWLAPVGLENGSWTAVQWPLYYWYLGALGLIPGLAASGFLLPVAGAIAGALAIFAIWLLAMTARFGARAAFAAGAIFLCSPLLAPLPHFTGPITLSIALVCLSLAFFCQGWRADKAWLSLPAAFVFTALAALCGGPLFMAVPILACFLYLFWALRWKRAQALDALCGFIIFLILIGWWLGTIMWGDQPQSYLATLFEDSWKLVWPPERIWWLAIAFGLGGTLPWLLVIFGVSWIRVFAKAGQTLGASRRDNGSAIIWLALVMACCLSIFSSTFHGVAIIIACLFAVLLGKAFVNLASVGNRLFFFLASLLVFLAGLCVLGASFPFSAQWMSSTLVPCAPGQKLLGWTPQLQALPIVGGILALGGLLGFVFVRRHHQGGGMIYALVFVIILCQPLALMLVPELGARNEARLETLAAIQKRVEEALKTPAPAVSEIPPQPSVKPDIPDVGISEQPAAEVDKSSGEQGTIEKSPEEAQTATSEAQAVPESGESAGPAAKEEETSQPAAPDSAEKAPAEKSEAPAEGTEESAEKAPPKVQVPVEEAQ